MVLTIFIVSMYMIDQPNIEFHKHGEYGMQLRFGPTGEIIGYAQIGLLDRLVLGLSYGASNLIGAGNPDFYQKPGIQAKILIVEQSFVVPQVIFGFDSQGYGAYYFSGYDIMSKGLYLQAGEVFHYPGFEIVPSLAINYSFEQDGRVDLFGGVVFAISSTQLIVDYSPNLNDNEDQNKGYLNTGIRFIFFEDLFFEFALRDLLNNSAAGDNQLNRMIKIGYKGSF